MEGLEIDWLAVGAILGPIIALVIGVWTQRRAAKADRNKVRTRETESAILAVKALNDALHEELLRLKESRDKNIKERRDLKRDLEEIREINESLMQYIKDQQDNHEK